MTLTEGPHSLSRPRCLPNPPHPPPPRPPWLEQKDLWVEEEAAAAAAALEPVVCGVDLVCVELSKVTGDADVARGPCLKEPQRIGLGKARRGWPSILKKQQWKSTQGWCNPAGRRAAGGVVVPPQLGGP